MSKKTELIYIDPEMDHWQQEPLLPVLVSKEILDHLMYDGGQPKYLAHGRDYILAEEGEEE